MSHSTQNRRLSWDSGSHSQGTIKTGQATIFESVLVARETTGGEYQHGGDDPGVVFAGVSLEEGDAGETIRVRCVGTFGPFAVMGGNLTDADIGREVSVIDDQTVGISGDTDNDVSCGRIFAVETPDTCRIRIDGHARG